MKKLVLAASAAVVVGTTALFAGSHAGPHDAAITARKAHMQLYAHNLGILGAMARGNAEYDADAASAAAANLAALTSISQGTYWPQGSDSGSVENTRALPALWENFDGVMEAAGAMNAAVEGVNAAAGGGLEALQAAMGPLGAACGGCHEKFRAPQ